MLPTFKVLQPHGRVEQWLPPEGFRWFSRTQQFWDCWIASLTQSLDMNLSKLLETVPGVLQSLGLQKVRHNLATEQQQQQQQQQRRRSQRQRKRPWEAGIGLVWPLAKECQQPLGGKKEKNKFFSWASRNDQILLTLWFRPHEAHLALLISL